MDFFSARGAPSILEVRAVLRLDSILCSECLGHGTIHRVCSVILSQREFLGDSWSCSSQFDAGRLDKKELKSSSDKNEGSGERGRGGRGGKRAWLSDPGSELRLGKEKREKKSAKVIIGMSEIK